MKNNAGKTMKKTMLIKNMLKNFFVPLDFKKKNREIYFQISSTFSSASFFSSFFQRCFSSIFFIIFYKILINY